jgi:hypothetical protein
MKGCSLWRIPSIDEANKLCDYLFENEKFKEVIDVLKVILEEMPQVSMIYSTLAIAYVNDAYSHDGDLGDAKKILDRGAKVEFMMPDDKPYFEHAKRIYE